MTRVSIIVPCYNEQSTIALLLQALYDQTYPRPALQVIIADGQSTDGTREVVSQFQATHPGFEILLVNNPRRNIPAGLNVALAAATGDIVVRLDAHSVPARDYVERCIADLESNLGDNVGGVWEIHPGSAAFEARAIAAAAAHPLGVGDALYRYTREAGVVDTVPFGSFYREHLLRIGGYDETLLSNEDYELNTRIRQQGGKVYLDPAIRSVYFARSTFSGLAKQYFRYGFWKFRMLRRYPDTIKWRQALPPLFVISVLVLALAGCFFAPARWLLLAELVLYFFILMAGSFPVAGKNRDLRFIIGVPLAIAVMHFSWGAGFLWSLIKSAVKS